MNAPRLTIDDRRIAGGQLRGASPSGAASVVRTRTASRGPGSASARSTARRSARRADAAPDDRGLRVDVARAQVQRGVAGRAVDRAAHARDQAADRRARPCDRGRISASTDAPRRLAPGAAERCCRRASASSARSTEPWMSTPTAACRGRQREAAAVVDDAHRPPQRPSSAARSCRAACGGVQPADVDAVDRHAPGDRVPPRVVVGVDRAGRTGDEKHHDGEGEHAAGHRAQDGRPARGGRGRPASKLARHRFTARRASAGTPRPRARSGTARRRRGAAARPAVASANFSTVSRVV